MAELLAIADINILIESLQYWENQDALGDISMALVDLMGMSASPDKSVEGLEKAKDAAILRQDIRQVTSQVATRLRVERTIPIKATLLSMRDTLETNEFIEDVL